MKRVEVFRVVDENDPRPGPGGVRVKVLAASVSFTDAQRRAGTYRRARYRDWFRGDSRVLLELLCEGKISPVVAERLPFTDARHAHELLGHTAAGKLAFYSDADA